METQQLATAPAASRGTKVLRVAAQALRRVGDLVGAAVTWAATIAVVVLIANDVAGFASALDRVMGPKVAVLILAAWGVAQLVESAAYGAADWIDPDARDGDLLWDVVKDLKQLAADVRQGADYDDVRLGVQASKLLPAVEQLLGAIGDMYDEDGEDDEASALYVAAVTVREAAAHLGEKYDQTA